MEHLSTSSIMASLEYCEVQIIHDKIDSSLFEFFGFSYLHPISIFRFNKSSFPDNDRDISRIRDSPCKISFLLAQYFLEGNVVCDRPFPLAE